MLGSPFELANASGDPLRGDVHLPDGDGRRPVVVICHGFKGFKNWGFFPELASRLAAGGFLGVAFNFSGSGIGADLLNFTDLERFARDTTSKQVADLGCVLDALHAGDIGDGRADLERVAVLGHSRGGAVALIRAHEDARVRAAVTWSGVSTLWRYSEDEVAAWKERGSMEFLNTRTKQMMRIDFSALEDLQTHRDRFDVARIARALSVPLLMVHGENDDVVPVHEARAIREAARNAGAALHIVPGAGHTFGAVHPWKGSTPALDAAIETTRTWLAQLWPGAGEGAET